MKIAQFSTQIEEYINGIKNNENICFTDFQKITYKLKWVEAIDQTYSEMDDFIFKNKDKIMINSLEKFKSDVIKDSKNLYNSKILK